MIRSLFVILLAVTIGYGQAPAPKNVDILASDGVKLRATFFAAKKPGPAVLLLHMCNTVRKSWEPVAKELSEKGINALTVDNRGFGESGGPRFEGAPQEVLQQLHDKWSGDFDAAYDFLGAQSGVDKARVAVGGGSCGVGNAVGVAERHPDLKSMVLLAGSTDLAALNYIAQHPEIPIFTAAAADDQYNPATLQVMQWYSDLSGNPRSKFSGFTEGRHGTEIFGPHPELVDQIVSFYVDTLVKSPVDLRSPVKRRKTEAFAFWDVMSQPGGAAKATTVFHEARKRDPKAVVFPEFVVNLLGYARLQAGDKQEAVELFKLNAEAYPTSANAQDSLSDGYLAVAQNDLALAAERTCLELLPADKVDAEFKKQLEQQAREKISKLEPEHK